MWNVQGKPAYAEHFRPFVAREVLYEFDGPRIFTLTDSDGELNLACWLEEDGNQSRFVVVPTAVSIIDSLRSGRQSVLDALNQPRCWICDVSHTGDVNQCWRVDFQVIPADSLPTKGTLLLPTIEPELIELEGRVRELDKDRLTLELREINGGICSQRFMFDEPLRDEVYRAFDDEVRVKLAGWKIPGKAVLTVHAISRIEAGQA